MTKVVLSLFWNVFLFSFYLPSREKTESKQTWSHVYSQRGDKQEPHIDTQSLSTYKAE